MQHLYVLKTNNLDRFKNKYRIPSARAQWWDYGWAANYFITICTYEKEHYFGEVVDGEMRLSDIGKIANKYWNEIPENFQFAKLDAYTIMPNHMHGILIIDKSDQMESNKNSSKIDRCRDAINRVSTWQESESKLSTEIDQIGGITGKHNPMLHDNIPRIIRWYKGRCTFEIRKTNSPFAWQPRYHDHIIRNEDGFQRISNYIKTNPENWEKDRFYTI